MSKKSKWIYIALGGVGALALAVAALFVVTHAAAAAGIVARPMILNPISRMWPVSSPRTAWSTMPILLWPKTY